MTHSCLYTHTYTHTHTHTHTHTWGFPGGANGKEPTGQCKRLKRWESIPGLGRSSGGGLSNPIQYSCLGNPMDREAWWATVHRITNSWTRLKRLRWHGMATLQGASLPVPFFQWHLLTLSLCAAFCSFLKHFKHFHYYVSYGNL